MQTQRYPSQPPPDATEMSGTHVDRSAEAEAIKAKAKLIFADMVRTGELKVPLDVETEARVTKEREVAREMQIKNVPKGVTPSSMKAGSRKPGHKSVIPRQQNVVPNYVRSFDYALNPQNQNYALISCLGPRGCTPRSDEFAFRIWGVFATKEDATEYTEYIRQANKYAKYYDILLLELGHDAPWAPFPPILDEIEQKTFQNEHIQQFNDSRLQAQKDASSYHSQRIEDAANEDINQDIARERKIRKMDKKFKQALALRAAKMGISVEQLLSSAGDDVFKIRDQAEQEVDAELEAAAMPKAPVVQFEQRRDEQGNVVTIRKTRKLVKKQRPQQ